MFETYICFNDIYIFAMVLGPYSTQLVGNSASRRGSTPIATVKQASTQVPHVISGTQKTSMYLRFTAYFFLLQLQ